MGLIFFELGLQGAIQRILKSQARCHFHDHHRHVHHRSDDYYYFTIFLYWETGFFSLSVSRYDICSCALFFHPLRRQQRLHGGHPQHGHLTPTILTFFSTFCETINTFSQTRSNIFSQKNNNCNIGEYRCTDIIISRADTHEHAHTLTSVNSCLCVCLFVGMSDCCFVISRIVVAIGGDVVSANVCVSVCLFVLVVVVVPCMTATATRWPARFFVNWNCRVHNSDVFISLPQ